MSTSSREFALLGIVTFDRERRLCQGREAPVGLGLDTVGVDDTLQRAKSVNWAGTIEESSMHFRVAA